MVRTPVLAAAVAGALAVSLLAATPSFATAASDSGSTTLTATLTGGSLSIAAPSTASLSGSAGEATVITGSMGTTTVTDDTGSLLGWSVTATATDLSDVVNSTTTYTIPLSDTGPLTLATGTITAVGSSLLTGVAAGAGGDLNPTTAITVATAVAGDGGGSYSYDPTLTLTVPANTYAGTYTSTITQTVTAG